MFMFMAILGLVATRITLDCENKKRNKLFILLACLSQGFLVSVSTELIQRVTPGRFFHWGDVWINMSGYLTGIFLAILVNFIIVGIKKIRNKSS